MDNGFAAYSALILSTWSLLQLLTFPQAIFCPPLSEEEEDDTVLTDIVRNVGSRLMIH